MMGENNDGLQVSSSAKIGPIMPTDDTITFDPNLFSFCSVHATTHVTVNTASF
jgi:hypothetical protein